MAQTHEGIGNFTSKEIVEKCMDANGHKMNRLTGVCKKCGARLEPVDLHAIGVSHHPAPLLPIEAKEAKEEKKESAVEKLKKVAKKKEK